MGDFLFHSGSVVPSSQVKHPTMLLTEKENESAVHPGKANVQAAPPMKAYVNVSNQKFVQRKVIEVTANCLKSAFPEEVEVDDLFFRDDLIDKYYDILPQAIIPTEEERFNFCMGFRINFDDADDYLVPFSEPPNFELELLEYIDYSEPVPPVPLLDLSSIGVYDD